MTRLRKRYLYSSVLVSLLVCGLVSSILLTDIARTRLEPFAATAARERPGSDNQQANLYPQWFNQHNRLAAYGVSIKFPSRVSSKPNDNTRDVLLTWQRHIFPRYQEIAVHVIHSLCLFTNGIIYLYLDIPPPFSASL